VQSRVGVGVQLSRDVCARQRVRQVLVHDLASGADPAL
jgi:hypothetical protein